MQMAGRILRPWGDVQPIILDHGGNVDRHKLPHIDREWSLEPTRKKRKFEDDIPMRICGTCFAYVMAGTKTCPHCEAERPEAQAEQRSLEPVPVDLALRTIEGEALAEGAIKKRFFLSTYRTARERGWLLGAILHRFRERFSEEPPVEWVDALRSDYRNDDEWKERVSEKRAARKALEAEAFGAGKREDAA
jgi:superfamily II DNA or RNA helicase